MVFLGHGSGMLSATCGILLVLMLRQAWTQAGMLRSAQPSQRLKSISVERDPADSARAVFGTWTPVRAAAPAEIRKKDLLLILEVFPESNFFPL